MRIIRFTVFSCLMAAVLIRYDLMAARASSVDNMHTNPVVRQAVEDLAQRESISADDIDVVSVEKVMWPDTSMGCPHPGMRYRQVPQDGLRIILRAQGSQHTYHSGGHRPPFLCDLKDARRGIDPGKRLPGEEQADK